MRFSALFFESISWNADADIGTPKAKKEKALLEVKR